MFGDGPYRRTEFARFRRLVSDVNAADLAWLVHVGDILWTPCSDAALAERLEIMNAFAHPVIYTPGDNEWTDCHESDFRPLERLAHLRHTFFADPHRSLGEHRIPLETQSADARWREFVENQRWRKGRVLFVTVHIVGSDNARERFEGRSAADDAEVMRRTSAAVDWIDTAFAIAARDSLRSVVIAMHGDPEFHRADVPGNAYEGVIERLAHHAATSPGHVLLIHGDSHEYILDHPLPSRPSFTRLETYGAPDIGWIRVVVDSLSGAFLEFEPRLMSPLGW